MIPVESYSSVLSGALTAALLQLQQLLVMTP
jgi:hypothetical protein